MWSFLECSQTAHILSMFPGCQPSTFILQRSVVFYFHQKIHNFSHLTNNNSRLFLKNSRAREQHFCFFTPPWSKNAQLYCKQKSQIISITNNSLYLHVGMAQWVTRLVLGSWVRIPLTANTSFSQDIWKEKIIEINSFIKSFQ